MPMASAETASAAAASPQPRARDPNMTCQAATNAAIARNRLGNPIWTSTLLWRLVATDDTGLNSSAASEKANAQAISQQVKEITQTEPVKPAWVKKSRTFRPQSSQSPVSAYTR